MAHPPSRQQENTARKAKSLADAAPQTRQYTFSREAVLSYTSSAAVSTNMQPRHAFRLWGKQNELYKLKKNGGGGGGLGEGTSVRHFNNFAICAARPESLRLALVGTTRKFGYARLLETAAALERGLLKFSYSKNKNNS